MGKKLNDILKENYELKKELEGILELIKENEVKQRGFKVVEYAFLMSDSLSAIANKPLKYLEEIFEIDKAAVFIDKGIFAFDRDSDIIGERIYFYDSKVFKYFFLEKRVYAGVGRTNFISEFDIFDKMQSYLVSPILENEEVVGSLNLYSSNPKRFMEKQSTDFLKDLSFKIGITLRKLYDAERLTKQMLIDHFTDTYNKIAMYDFLERFINMYQRYKKPFAFGILDLDNFKEVNDKMGHLVGDEFLKIFCEKMKKSIRKADIFGRFGGDEFYLIIPEADEEMIRGSAKRIKAIVEEVRDKMKLPGNLDISGGFILIPSNDIAEISTTNIIRMADEKLYCCKSDSKGKIIGVGNDCIS